MGRPRRRLRRVARRGERASARPTRGGIIALVLLAGCGGDSGPISTDEPEPDPSPYTMVACPALSLAASEGVPLAEIGIGDLPASFGRPVVAVVGSVTASTPDVAFVLPLEEGDEEPLRLVVPVHPDGPDASGAVELTFTDGALACAPVSFTLQTLPRADGELAAVVDGFQAVLAAQAQALGIEEEELTGSAAGDLPSGAVPLAVAQILLDHPDNDESLEAMSKGILDPESLDLLDRLLARTGLRAELERTLEPGAVTGGAPQASAASPATCTATTLLSAALLNDCMAAAVSAKFHSTGASRKVEQMIAACLAEGSKAGLPLAAALDVAFSALSFLYGSQLDKAAGLYPSSFVSMGVGLSRPMILEDDSTHGEVAYATVSATSEGYDLQAEILNGIKQAWSVAKAAGKWDPSLGEREDEAAGEIERLAEKGLGGKRIEDFVFEPETFGPVDVNDPAWIQLKRIAGDAVEVVPQTLVYLPYVWGDAILSIRTFDGKFGGQQIERQAEVRIPPIQMVFMPDDTLVLPHEPGSEFLELELKVIDAKYPDSVDLDLSEHPRQGVAEIRITQGGQSHYVDYVAPGQPDFNQPDLVVARHLVREGARKNRSDPTATATIRFGFISVTTSASCLEPGMTATFEAEVRGVESDEVTWSAEVGDIDEHGVFTAPMVDAGTDVEIRATSVEEPRLEGSATVRVGGCSCYFEMNMSGPGGGSSDGPAGFVIVADGALEINLQGTGPATSGDALFAGVRTDPGWVPSPGAFAVAQGSWGNLTTNGGIGYQGTYRPEWGEGFDCASCGGTITIDAFSDDFLSGSIAVIMPTGLPSEGLAPTLVEAEFNAARGTSSDAQSPYMQCVASFWPPP